MPSSLNIDCLLLVLEQIEPGERSRYRSVCHRWRDMIDYLAYRQRSLKFISSTGDTATPTTGDATPTSFPISDSEFPNFRPSSSSAAASSCSCDSCRSSSAPTPYDLFAWPHLNISYPEFVRILERFPNVRSLSFAGFTHWNDHHLIRLTESARSLHTLAFYSCPHLGDNYFNDFGFHNVTQIGWQAIATRYASSLTTLTFEDCDLENYHFSLIVRSFPQLRHLNVANNSEITDFTPLASLTASSIEVLKLGPKLSVNGKKFPKFDREMPIDEILAGAARHSIRSLQLQGCLTTKLAALAHAPKLDHLILKYASFASVDSDILELENDIIIRAACRIAKLRRLDLYQINQSNSIDLHWLRQRMQPNGANNQFRNHHHHHHHHQHHHQRHNRRNSISTFPIRIENTTLTNAPIATATTAITIAKSLPNLEHFSLYTVDPFIAVEQFRLIDFVLGSAANLRSFALSCASFDASMHDNLNQTIITLLQKYNGNSLRDIRLENLFPLALYSYLAYVILTMPAVERVTIEDREMSSFLHCVDLQIDQLQRESDSAETSEIEISTLDDLDVPQLRKRQQKQPQQKQPQSQSQKHRRNSPPKLDIIFTPSSSDCDDIANRRVEFAKNRRRASLYHIDDDRIRVHYRSRHRDAALRSVDADDDVITGIDAFGDDNIYGSADGNGAGAGAGADGVGNGSGSGAAGGDSGDETENDLADLCRLLDTSCDLIGHAVDIVTLCASYYAFTISAIVSCRLGDLVPRNLPLVPRRWLSSWFAQS